LGGCSIRVDVIYLTGDITNNEDGSFRNKGEGIDICVHFQLPRGARFGIKSCKPIFVEKQQSPLPYHSESVSMLGNGLSQKLTATKLILS